MTSVDTAVELYRFADKAHEVNWNARAQPDMAYVGTLLPDMMKFTADTIQKVTYTDGELRAVVPVSGGLDSSTAAVLVAETMREYPQLKSSLVLLGFEGVNDEDTNYFVRFQKWFSHRYRDVRAKCIRKDASSFLMNSDKFIETLMQSSGMSEVYEGELPSSFLMNAVQQYAERIAHAHVDTTNGTEVIIGEITLGAGGDFCPFSDFLKTYVWAFGELLGIPSFILNRNPQNTSLGNDKISAYFGEIPRGLSPKDVYAVLDPALYGLWELDLSPATVARHLGHSKRFVRRIYDRICNQEHRQYLPFFVHTNKTTVYRTDRSKRSAEIERRGLYESARKK